MEFYNSRKDEEFNLLVKALNSSKMLEVCSTTLPQMAIPAIMGHPSYKAYRQKLNEEIEERGNIAYDLLRKVNGLVVNRTLGAFYMTVLFKEGVLKPNLCLKLKNPDIQNLVDKLVAGQKLDKRFVYYLLASRGICVVPISSFCSGYMGFRITLLEVDKKRMQWIFKNLRDAITEYLTSA
jgi:aspartate/methionine/tyrosine aminotransferase